MFKVIVGLVLAASAAFAWAGGATPVGVFTPSSSEGATRVFFRFSAPPAHTPDYTESGGDFTHSIYRFANGYGALVMQTNSFGQQTWRVDATILGQLLCQYTINNTIVSWHAIDHEGRLMVTDEGALSVLLSRIAALPKR
jgi:hypothetical protein